jgi:hypothetical protein
LIVTVLDDGGAFIEESEDVFGVGVQKRVGEVLDVLGDLEVLHP